MKTYDTPESRAARILAIQGKGRAALANMNEEEIAALAALVNEQGEAVDGAAEKYAEILRGYYDRFKATDGDSEPKVDVAAQQKVRDEAAKLVAAGKAEPAQQPVKSKKAKRNATEEGE